MNFDRHRIDGDGSGGRTTGSHGVVVTLLITILPPLAGHQNSHHRSIPSRNRYRSFKTSSLKCRRSSFETSTNIDDQAAVNNALSAKVKALDKALEDHETALPPPAPVLNKSTSLVQAVPEKKASKKPAKSPVKKKPAAQSQLVRRQEQ